jgi:hypothetical protein
MASGDRSKKIRQRVQTLLKDPKGLLVRYQDVYDALNRVQRRITEDSECIEATATVDLDGSESYSLPDDCTALRKVEPVSGTEPIEKVNVDDGLALRRNGTSSTDDSTLVYYQWEGKLVFLNASGSFPSSGSVTIYFWRSLAATGEDMSDTLDPVVHNRWDETLVNGAVADLSGEDKWEAKYDREFGRVLGKEKSINSETFSIPPTQEYD